MYIQIFIYLLSFFAALFLIFSISARILSMTRAVLPISHYIICVLIFSCLITEAATYICGITGVLNSSYILLLLFAVYLPLLLKAGPMFPEQYKIPCHYYLCLFFFPAILSISFLAVYLPLCPAEWDAMTYHLYIPCRWVQEGMIFHIPTAFGDNAAAFAPKGWELFTAFVLSFLHSDTLMNCVSLIFLFLSALCVYEISLEIGSEEVSAIIAASVFFCIPALFRETFTANADIYMLAFLCASLLFFLRSVREGKIFDIALCGISLGLAMGSKTAASAFVFPLIVLLFLRLTCRRNFRGILCFLMLIMLAVGWNYLENFLRFGNPFFPLNVSLMDVNILEGAYGTNAIKAGEFHAPALSWLFKALSFNYGLLTLMLIPCGTAGFLFSLRGGKRVSVMLTLLIFILWLFSYIFIIPHNMETRFMFPALAVSMTGFALFLGILKNRPAQVLIYLLYSGVFIFMGFYSLSSFSKRVPLLLTGLLAVSLLAEALLAYFLCRKFRKIFFAILAVLMFSTLYMTELSAPGLRTLNLRMADFAGWLSEIYQRFNVPVNGAPPLTIAYSGNNLPYAFVGYGLKNKVIYCNVQGDCDDNFYDFWNKDRKQYPYHKPDIYRNKPDYTQWLENLRKSKATILVISMKYPASEPASRICLFPEDGFPVEDKWASCHPEKFILADKTRNGRIYIIKPE